VDLCSAEPRNRPTALITFTNSHLLMI